jgi:[acyl-carrier-protein] S-malonyltransferase
MQEAVPEGTGAMAAVLGLDDRAVSEACVEAAQEEIVEAVNFNAPGQVVIAGHAAAVKRGVEAAKARGAKRAVLLPVSAPFHSSLMAPAARVLREALASRRVLAPRIPVIHNVDAAPHAEPDAIREALYRQADHPVLWSGCIKTMAAASVTHVYECGPGKVLGPLSKRIAVGLQGGAWADRSAMEQALQELGAARHAG